MFKRIGTVLVVALIGVSCLELGEKLEFPACMGSSQVPRPQLAAP